VLPAILAPGSAVVAIVATARVSFLRSKLTALAPAGALRA
jgi:hypothetical protein